MPSGQAPNVVLIMADQLNPTYLGAYGSTVAKTPHIDRLAESGAVFENFYCNSPLCVPSRASMVSGQLITKVGTFDNGSELPASVPTFMHHLRRAGYDTALSGKMHFIGPDQLHGFSERLTTDIYPSNFGWSANWRLGLEHGEDQGGIHPVGPVKWSTQLDYDYETHTRALERIRRFGQQEDQCPFLLCVSYTHPHDPFVITREYWDRFEEVEIPLPRAPAVPVEAMHPFNQWIQKRHGLEVQPSAEEVVAVRRAYFAMVSYFDDLVGELIAELSRFDLLEDTIVVVTSDHGEMMGEHGMWYKRTFFEDSLRVPFIVSCPSRWVGGKRVTQPASLVDLFPTLLEFAHVDDREEISATLDGTSLEPSLAGRPRPDRPVIAEYCAEGVLEPAFAIRSGAFKYVYVAGTPPLLFNLEDDPLEQRNLAGDAACQEVEQELAELVPGAWRDGSLKARVLDSQRQRTWLVEAMRHGGPSWDFQPVTDASRSYRRDVR